MIRRALLGLLGVIALLALLLVANTLRQGSRQPAVVAVPPLAVNEAQVAEALAAAVRARTVSGLHDPAAQDAAFAELHALLASRYPAVHAALQREVVGRHGLLYTWRGEDPKAAPVALMAHQDVVPLAPGTEPLWQQPPFAGLVSGGYVWGRGTLDDKSSLIAQFEALELLVKAGLKPRRTVYFVFGHDEEVGGHDGAARVAARFKDQGVVLDWVLDEGLAITEGIIPGVKAPVGLVGLAEKGWITLRLSTQAAPGHSSMPPGPGQSAIGRLTQALARLDAQPLPGGIQGAAAEMFQAIAPELPFGQRLAMSNLWLLRPVVEAQLGQAPSTNALMRTTTALTVLKSGSQDNVLPGMAEALVNFRVLPGETMETVQAAVKRIVADDAVQVTLLPGGSNPSRLSSSAEPSFQLLARTVREVFPDVLVAPGLMLAASDARHFDAVSKASYRFMPVRFRADDLRLPHGTNERIAVSQLADMVRFYHRLLSQAVL